MRHLGSIAILAVLWFGLALSFELAEVLAATAVTTIAVAAHGLLRRRAQDADARVLAWTGQALSAWPRRIVTDALVVLRAVLHARSHAGDFRQVDMPEGGARHVAWSVVGTSISPNAFIVSCEQERREIVIHELVPSKRPDAQLLWWPK